MNAEFDLDEVTSFEELVALMDKEIIETVTNLGQTDLPTDLSDGLKIIIETLYKEDLKRYGWSGKEKLPTLKVVNYFHQVFSTFHSHVYVNWFQKNYKDLENENPFFNAVDSDFTYEILQANYSSNGVELTDKLLIEELKRGLHISQFDLAEQIKYVIEDCSIASIHAEGDEMMDSTIKELKDILEQFYRIRKDMFNFSGRIEELGIKNERAL